MRQSTPDSGSFLFETDSSDVSKLTGGDSDMGDMSFYIWWEHSISTHFLRKILFFNNNLHQDRTFPLWLISFNNYLRVNKGNWIKYT